MLFWLMNQKMPSPMATTRTAAISPMIRPLLFFFGGMPWPGCPYPGAPAP